MKNCRRIAGTRRQANSLSEKTGSGCITTQGCLVVKEDIALPVHEGSMRVVSYNIRMVCQEDAHTVNAWKNRCAKVAMIFNHYKPEIVGLQELSSEQVDALEQSSTSKLQSYKFLTRYPTSQPIESGLGIMYNAGRIKPLTELKTFWLNESQTDPNSLAWDGSSYERYAIYAQFEYLSTQKKFWFMTTHFDHLGTQARTESAKLIMSRAKQLDGSVVITGDFNTFPQLKGQELYELLCSYNPNIKDSYELAESRIGVQGSWIGWEYDNFKQQANSYAVYDYIFVPHATHVIQHAIIDDTVWDEEARKELYPSDHRPVLVDLVLK